MRFRPIATLAAALALPALALHGLPVRAQPAPARAEAPAAVPAPAGPKAATAPRVMVSAANPLAVQAGVKILKAGGSAVDAAVAIQAVLGLVEPQSSGLGGGAFLMFYDAKARTVVAYDGREVAPQGATPDMFLGPDDEPVPFGQAIVGGRAAGVPGAIAMLSLAHKEHGRLAWSTLFEDAAALAEAGFVISPRLGAFVASTRFPQATRPDVAAYFTKADGTRYRTGEVLKNPAYADTLRRLAAQGPDALLKGPTAEKIVAKLAEAPLPSTMTLADLAAYRPNKAPAVCRPFRIYTVCTPPPPSSGAVLLELLGMLERTDIAKRGPADPQGWFQFAEASRLMYADRDHYFGDPAFVDIPLKGLLDPAYLKRRAALIGRTAAKTVEPGRPMGALAMGPDHTLEPGGTSSFAIVDARGDVLAMTTTVESIFGNGRMVDGFFLNNELTDFSLAPLDPDGRPAANAVGPGRRPRSSMAPTIVLDRKGRFVAAVGSPGGTAILAYVGKALVGTLAWGLPLPEAIGLPNLIARGDVAGIESTFDPAIAEALKARGLTVVPGRGEESGLHGVQKVPGGYLGAADPRREGVAVGF